MPASENKKLMQHIFFELSKGNSRPFAESMADDFSWTITGTTKWSKKYDGKQAVTRRIIRRSAHQACPPNHCGSPPLHR